MAATQTRIAVMGAGAVGGYFGAKLAASGHEVAFIARGEHLKAMRADGLKIKSAEGDLHIRALFTSDLEEVGAVDLVLFCVKSYGTEEAARKLAPLLQDKTVILSLQNGVDNPDKIAKLWGKGRTLAGVIYIGARILSPGVIEHSAGGRIIMGELDGTISQSTKAVQEIFAGAQVPCTVSPEIRKAMWGKLVWNAPFCAISCLARATTREIVESESLRKLAIDCMAEVIEAAKSEGFELAPTIVEETLNLSRSLGNFKPSMLQDLESGKPLEYEAFNGLVSDVLRRAGKEAPVNRIFYGALKFLDQRLRAGGAA
jgi:2-dehydropantoate 2-reductase